MILKLNHIPVIIIIIIWLGKLSYCISSTQLKKNKIIGKNLNDDKQEFFSSYCIISTQLKEKMIDKNLNDDRQEFFSHLYLVKTLPHAWLNWK